MNQPRPNYVPQMQSIAERINNPPRLVQCIQAHNEEEFIGLTLASIYNEVDRIIVIEGAVVNRPNQTEEGHSTDRTWEIIEEFVANSDPEGKVIPIRMKKPWDDLEAMKTMFLNLMEEGDWVIINDADEFYRPEDIRRLRVAIDRYPHAHEFVPTFLHFYRDFNHVAVPGPEWQPQHQRVFRFSQNMKYNSHPIVTMPDGHCSYFSMHMQPRRFMLNDFFIYHYGYARSGMDEVMRQKREYYEQELAKHGGANAKFDQKVTDWENGTEPILEFDGEHPEIVKSHPMFGVDAVNVNCPTWRTNEFYSKVINNEPYGNIWLCMTGQSAPMLPMYHNGVTIDVEVAQVSSEESSEGESDGVGVGVGGEEVGSVAAQGEA